MSDILTIIGVVIAGIIAFIFGRNMSGSSREVIKKEYEIDKKDLDEKIKILQDERKKLLAKGEDPIEIPDVKDDKAVVEFFNNYFKDKDESN